MKTSEKIFTQIGLILALCAGGCVGDYLGFKPGPDYDEAEPMVPVDLPSCSENPEILEVENKKNYTVVPGSECSPIARGHVGKIEADPSVNGALTIEVLKLNRTEAPAISRLSYRGWVDEPNEGYRLKFSCQTGGERADGLATLWKCSIENGERVSHLPFSGVSDEWLNRMDLDQLDLSDGPCGEELRYTWKYIACNSEAAGEGWNEKLTRPTVVEGGSFPELWMDKRTKNPLSLNDPAKVAGEQQ